MSEYTTGELANVTNVSIRTIQFYDKKNILKPSHVFENGKRIYTDEDLGRLKLIILLKNLGLTLKSISEILNSKNSSKVLDLLLDQQLKIAQVKVKTSKDQIKMIENVKHSLPQVNNISIQTIDDMDKIMNNKKALRKVHVKMLVYGLLMDAVEIGSLVWGIAKGQWIPFVIAMFVAIIMAIILVRFYFNKVNYVCPNCNYEFKPKFWAAFFSGHSPKTRKLVCPNCNKRDYCIEIFDEKSNAKFVR